jgi:hypothetical protein
MEILLKDCINERDLKPTPAYRQAGSPSSLGGCVATIMMGDGFRRNRQSGYSALEHGLLKVWAIGLLRDGILFRGLEPRS